MEARDIYGKIQYPQYIPFVLPCLSLSNIDSTLPLVSTPSTTSRINKCLPASQSD